MPIFLITKDMINDDRQPTSSRAFIQQVYLLPHETYVLRALNQSGKNYVVKINDVGSFDTLLLEESFSPIWRWERRLFIWPRNQKKPIKVKRFEESEQKSGGSIGAYSLIRPQFKFEYAALYVDQGNVRLRIGTQVFDATDITDIESQVGFLVGRLRFMSKTQLFSIQYVRPVIQGFVFSDGQITTNDLDIFRNFYLIATQEKSKQDFVNAYSGGVLERLTRNGKENET